MNRKQLNIVEAASTVAAYMAKPENNVLWQGNQAISDTMVEINGNLTTIAALEKKQKAPVTGPAADKATLRYDYEDEILRIANQLASLGAKTKNATLEAQAELTMPGLDKLAADDLVATAGRIGDLATTNLVALAGYNVTQAHLTGLAGMTTQFQGAKTKPREAVVDRKKETDLIQPVVSSLLSTLRRQLDRQMVNFKRTNPEFYRGYVAARVIVDRGNPKKKTTPATPTP